MAPRLPARCLTIAQQSTHRTCPVPSSLLASSTTQAQNILHSTSQATSQPFTPLTTRRGIKYGWSTLPARSAFQQKYNKGNGLPLPTTSPEAARLRKNRTTPIRTGVLATKKGMTGYYTHKGKRFACTILQMDRVQVVAHKTVDKHGYFAVQVGCGARLPDNETAPMLGYYEAKGIAPKEHLAEFQVRDESGLAPVGWQLLPDWFHKGQRVDVRGDSKGKGFAGGMKKHGFSGQGASHGNSKNHRTMGSVGQSQGGGSRVYPGKRMPGRMGNERVTVQNLPILRVDNELGIIVVKGAVPGPKGTVVKIADAIKKDPPTREFVDKLGEAMQTRFPMAEKDLKAARIRHLELKELRKDGSLQQALKDGLVADGSWATGFKEARV